MWKRVNVQLIKRNINTNMSNHRIPVFLPVISVLCVRHATTFQKQQQKNIKRKNRKSITNKNSVYILRGKLYQQNVFFLKILHRNQFVCSV